jgi:hypothetical protein
VSGYPGSQTNYLVLKDGTGLGLGTGHASGHPDVFFDWNSNGTTGSLTIAPNTSTIGSYDVYLKGSGASGGISILNGGAVELHYGSNGKRFETSAQGVNVTGRIAAESLSLDFGGSINAAGTSIDFQNTTISFSGASIGGLQSTINAGVDVHLNTSGASSGEILSWNGTDYAWVADQTGGGSAAEVDTLDTVTGRGNITSNNIEVGDLTATRVVINDANVQIYRDGANNLKIAVAGSNNLDITANVTTMKAGLNADKTALKLTSSGAAELYYDSNKKFETTTTGATVTGSLDLPNVNSYITGGGHNVLQVDSGKTYFYGGTSGVEIRKSDNSAFIVTVDDDGNSVFYGTVSDSIGDVRYLGTSSGGTGNYTLVSSDAGKQVRVNGAHTITIPNNVFGTGSMITVVAHSSSDVTINQGSGMTLYNAADGSSGNFTLAARTVCSILYGEGGGSSIAYIAGGGIS